LNSIPSRRIDCGKEYSFVLETENNSTGAAKMRLFWKTPSVFAKEKIKEKEKDERYISSCSKHLVQFLDGRNF